MTTALDQRIRGAAFELLARLCGTSGELVSRRDLVDGFVLDGHHVPLVAQWGIWKPKVADVPLSISTSPLANAALAPGEPVFGADGRIRYTYRGTQPYQANGLREAMRLRAPLAYFHGVSRGQYRAFWPVYVLSDDTESQAVIVSLAAEPQNRS